MGKIIKMGFVGLGRIGWSMAKSELTKYPEKFTIVAACDLIADRTAKVAELYPGCKEYADYAEMLKQDDIDVVYIATRSCDHFEHAMMALKAGAALDGVTNQQIEWYGLAYKVASEELGTGILHLVDAMAPDSRIFVNGSGKRFMDEEFNFMHSKSDLPIFEYDGQFPNYNGYKNLPMYTIFDSTIYNAGPVGPRDYNCGYASMFQVYNWSENNEAELERGWLVKADTIEELVVKLAEQSGNEAIDAEVLKQTIAEYNAACEAGVDPAFGRDALLLSKLDNPPYYAAELIPGAIYTIGGLQGGENGETLDWDGNPIPRLYHAGDIGQPTMLRVYGFEGAMASGEIAGEACSKLDSH